MITHSIIKHKPQWQVGTVRPAWSAPIRTKEEWDKYVQSLPFKEGDYLVYDYANTQTLKDTRSVNLVVAIKREFSEERWPLHSQHPTCVYLMALGGFIGPNSPAKAFTRWTDADTMRKLTDEEMKLLENDFLQNYIQENLARARAEAGV